MVKTTIQPHNDTSGTAIDTITRIRSTIAARIPNIIATIRIISPLPTCKLYKVLTFNTIIRENVLKTRMTLNINTNFREGGHNLKIYDYKGRKNISGNRIREARLKKRLSQADFAAKLQIAGITMERDSVSRIEIGTRFVADYELMIIAEILDVTVDWLLSEDCE